MFLLYLEQRVIAAFDDIDIQNDQTGFGAGYHANIGPGRFPPPVLYHVNVSTGILQALRNQMPHWVLSGSFALRAITGAVHVLDAVDGEYWPPQPLRISQSGVKHIYCLRMRCGSHGRSTARR